MFEAFTTPLTRALKSRAWHAAAAGALVFGAAALALPALADMHHPGMQGDGPALLFMGPAEHIAQHVDHYLKGLNATDAQRTQITQIAQAAAADLKAQHGTERSLHQQGLQIFTAATVDPTAAESVRAQLQVQHDQASRRVLQAMLDISQVLTPEQRAAIGARAQQREAAMQQRMQQHQQQGQQ
jgi:Spy/CpxP family protein refolding chaperone